MTPTTMDSHEKMAVENAEYKRLLQKHHEYEKRLEVLQGLRFMSDAERGEQTRLKKMKLAIKDQMEQLARECPE